MTVCGDCINCKETADGGFNHYICKELSTVISVVEVELDTLACKDHFKGYYGCKNG